MHIACLHTAKVHVETFDLLFQAQAPTAKITHVVRPDLLDAARRDGLDAIAADTSAALADLRPADVTLCTCSTLGPLVPAGALRIDRPAMEAAIRLGPDIAVALCLASTEEPTLSLLHDIAQELGRTITPRIVRCHDAWPHFEAGDMAAFAQSIAHSVQQAKGCDSVLLAQASMRVAAPLLTDLGLPVLTTPELAVQRAIDMATG